MVYFVDLAQCAVHASSVLHLPQVLQRPHDDRVREKIDALLDRLDRVHGHVRGRDALRLHPLDLRLVRVRVRARVRSLVVIPCSVAMAISACIRYVIVATMSR